MLSIKPKFAKFDKRPFRKMMGISVFVAATVANDAQGALLVNCSPEGGGAGSELAFSSLEDARDALRLRRRSVYGEGVELASAAGLGPATIRVRGQCRGGLFLDQRDAEVALRFELNTAPAHCCAALLESHTTVSWSYVRLDPTATGHVGR